ncbi:MAG: hypothetical protein JNL58_30610 [Planctomyces sp.]|nr:hypothetical protein [Planctomyces sp.]
MQKLIRPCHVVSILLMYVVQMTATADEPKEVPAAISRIQEQVTADAKKRLEPLSTIDDQQPQAIGKYSSRGDAQMFLADFKAAVGDYQSMVRLDPATDTSHWRLGIALFFAGQPKEAAAQFDKYHAFDNVDRENGIWRFLSHYRAYGPEQARKELLKYEKDDRPPFPEVYRLFDGSMTPEQVLKSIPEDLSDAQKNSRLFYSHLYIGMLQVVEGKDAEAKQSLAKAIENPWPREAGFGPNYMWHVARLQYFELK